MSYHGTLRKASYHGAIYREVRYHGTIGSEASYHGWEEEASYQWTIPREAIDPVASIHPSGNLRCSVVSVAP